MNHVCVCVCEWNQLMSVCVHIITKPAPIRQSRHVCMFPVLAPEVNKAPDM